MRDGIFWLREAKKDNLFENTSVAEEQVVSRDVSSASLCLCVEEAEMLGSSFDQDLCMPFIGFLIP